MPVTAKLSRKFYETFGDEIANELVEWFNAVDTTYRADLRELNELNFARFDAKLEQRMAESDARWERRMAEFEKRWEGRMAESDARWERRVAAVERDLAQLRGELQSGLAGLKSDLLKWMFVFWATTGLAILGLVLRS